MEEPVGDRFLLVRLPECAPELSPVERIRAYMQQRKRANRCLQTIGEAGACACRRLEFMQCRPPRIVIRWKQAELPNSYHVLT
jgi:transposase